MARQSAIVRDRPDSVSYTHLDVYKRQAYNKKESKLAEEEKREPELMPPISSHTLRPVSYTHLDVYKRQMSPSFT